MMRVQTLLEPTTEGEHKLPKVDVCPVHAHFAVSCRKPHTHTHTQTNEQVAHYSAWVPFAPSTGSLEEDLDSGRDHTYPSVVPKTHVEGQLPLEAFVWCAAEPPGVPAGPR